MTAITPSISSSAARAGTAPRTLLRTGPDAATRPTVVERAPDLADPLPTAPSIPGAGKGVIASGRGGVRHPIVYEADRSQRFVRVPDTDQPIAFLLAVYG